MTVETAFFIKDLNESYPRARDLINEGDDHIRLIKSTIKNTLPGFDKAVTFSADDLNKIDSFTTVSDSGIVFDSNLTIGSGKVVNLGGGTVKGVGTPVAPTDAVNLAYLQNTGSWPVNSIFMTIDTRNPNSILGFGTWESFAQGRVIIGSGSGTDTTAETRVFTNGNKSGEYSHKITTGELPVHSFSLAGVSVGSSGDHNHRLPVGGGSDGPREVLSVDSEIDTAFDWKGPTSGGSPSTYNAGAHTHPLVGSLPSVGGDEKHNNMQPYIVCNIWVRTA